VNINDSVVTEDGSLMTLTAFDPTRGKGRSRSRSLPSPKARLVLHHS
jgi:hypothetical protein